MTARRIWLPRAYSINRLALDIDAGAIRLDLDEAASIGFVTVGVDIDVEIQALMQ